VDRLHPQTLPKPHQAAKRFHETAGKPQGDWPARLKTLMTERLKGLLNVGLVGLIPNK